MENAASIDPEAMTAGVTHYEPPSPLAPLESSADRVARIGGRTARRALAVDTLVLLALSFAYWSLAPVVGAAEVSLPLALMLCVFTLIAFAASSLYATVQRPNPDALEEARRVGIAVVFAAFAWILVATIVRDHVVETRFALLLLGWMALASLLTLACRRSIRRRALIADPDRILIVGAGSTAQMLAQRAMATTGVTVVGFIDDDPLPLDPSLQEIPLFDDSEGIAATIEATGATRLVIAFSRRSPTDILESIRNSRFGAVPISVVPRYFEITPAHARLSEIDGVPMLDLHSARLSWGARMTKRVLDVTLASVGLLLLSPLFASVAIAIKLTSKGPVFFGQERTGHNGRVFKMWKFRTMVKDAEGWRMELAHLNDMGESTPIFKIRNDPRITRVGGFLRKYSIDELPQLINVVTGSMSLVGPRPFVCHEADLMQGWSQRRLDLVPGITGLWQVRGRNDVPYVEMIRLDYMYVTNWSVWWDLRLLLQTVPSVLTGKGAS
jgi:exopolysaccharide biosynthesis polyprenyl glycosylphosphotransferase